MAPLSNQQFTAYVGIDWADTKHDICLQAAGYIRREFDCIPHQVAHIDEWAKSLQRRFGGPIAVALELARGPIVAALQKYDFFTLFPINPSTLRAIDLVGSVVTDLSELADWNVRYRGWEPQRSEC